MAARATAFALCVFLFGARASAQQSEPPDAPAKEPAENTDSDTRDTAGDGADTTAEAPQTKPRSGVPAAPDKPRSCEQGCLRAETQGGGREHFWAEGYVDFEIGDVRIQCDRIDLYETPLEGGGTTRRVVAQGNVVFVRSSERIAGDRLEMDLGTNRGVFENALGYVDPGVFIEADRIERIDADTYTLRGARFTSCAQPNPRWAFTTSKATLHRDDKIVAKNVSFRIKSVPAFYVPIFLYPLKEDQRATGFLFPRFGYSSLRGFNVGSGFFWAMGRSYDQTFSVDYYSRFGTGYGHEFRYEGRDGSRGSLTSELIRRTDIEGDEHDLNWNAVQALPGGFRATLDVRRFSSTAFQQLYRDDLDQASRRQQRATFDVRGRVWGNTLQIRAESNETFFGDERTRVNQRIPMIRLRRSPRRLGRTGIVFQYEAGAERLSRGAEDVDQAYSRFDVSPQLSRPWATTFLQVNPRVGMRYTRYSATIDEELEGVQGSPLDRRIFESDVELRGPLFSKIFVTPNNAYSPRFKHEIGPEFKWTYRTPVDDFSTIPKFDGNDQLLGTNQVAFGLVQRLLAKRPDRSGRLTTHELAYWQLTQTYYVQIGERQNEFDPNFSSSAFGPGGEPRHLSPIRSRFRLTPTRSARATFDAEYDVNFNQIRTMGAGLRLNVNQANLDVNWSLAKQVSEDPERRVTRRNTIRTSGGVKLFTNRLALSGAVDYDLLDKSVLRTSARVDLRAQCCGVSVEMIDFNYNGRDERTFRFAIELENLGSFGLGGEQGLQVRGR